MGFRVCEFSARIAELVQPFRHVSRIVLVVQAVNRREIVAGIGRDCWAGAVVVCGCSATCAAVCIAGALARIAFTPPSWAAKLFWLCWGGRGCDAGGRAEPCSCDSAERRLLLGPIAILTQPGGRNGPSTRPDYAQDSLKRKLTGQGRLPIQRVRLTIRSESSRASGEPGGSRASRRFQCSAAPALSPAS